VLQGEPFGHNGFKLVHFVVKGVYFLSALRPKSQIAVYFS
jgi:hypothetical protein